MNLRESLSRLTEVKLRNGQTQKGDFKENKKKKKVDFLQRKTTGLSVGTVTEPRMPCKIFKAKEQTLCTKDNAHRLLRMSGRQNFEISIMYGQENECSKVVRGLSFS